MRVSSHFQFVLRLVRKFNNPKILLAGPPGAGKTSVAYWVAEKISATVFEFRCHHGLLPQDLLFEYQVKPGNQVIIQKSEIWKSFEASHRQRVILLIDEIDKLSPKSEATLLRLLETYSFTSPLDEPVEAKPQNVIVIATSNETRDLQEATLRRFPFRIRVSFPSIEQQVKIVQELLPDSIPEQLIEAGVRLAEALRQVDPNKAPSYPELALFLSAIWHFTPKTYSEFLSYYGYMLWKGSLDEVKLPRFYKFVLKLKQEVGDESQH